MYGGVKRIIIVITKQSFLILMQVMRLFVYIKTRLYIAETL